MSEAILKIAAQSREHVGKGASRRLRRQHGLVPAIVYGTKKQPLNLTVKHHEMLKAVQHEAFFSSILTLEIDGKAEKVVLKDMQRHPARELILHVDFLRIDEKAEMTMYIPLHFIGEASSPGVKAGGLVNHAMLEVEIKCLPANLPEAINVDVSTLNIGDSVHISAIVLPEGVSLVHAIEDEAHNHLVYSISEPKAFEEISDAAPVAAETEVLADKGDKDSKE